jgi:hypothetical protein
MLRKVNVTVEDFLVIGDGKDLDHGGFNKN